MSAPASDTWTPERVDRLRELVGGGATFQAIAAALGVSKNAAIGKANRMGFKPREGAPLNPTQRRLREYAGRKALTSRAAERAWRFPDAGGCVWPHGDPRAPGFHFCAAPVAGLGLPYCHGHMAMAYVAAAGREAA